MNGRSHNKLKVANVNLKTNRLTTIPRGSVKGVKFKVSANGRYFTTQDGEPFFYLADTPWTLFKRLNHEDVDVYCRNRVAKGFTVIQAYVLRGLRETNLYGALPLTDRDPARPNEAFFENVDYVVNKANELGLVVGAVTCWGEYVRGIRTDQQVFNTSNAFVYGRFLGDRYKDNAVMWLLGGDRSPFDSLGKDIWCAMAKGLREGSRGNNLISYHGWGHWESPSSSFWFHNEDWLDFNTIQSGHGWAISNYDFVTHDYNMKPVKPTLDMEARYENLPDYRTGTRKRMDAHQAREAMYWAVLAGAAGHGYGCNDIWQFYDEAESPYIVDDTELASYPTTNWHEAMDFEGAFGVGIARRLFELRPWYHMVPDQTVIAEGQGEGEDHIQAARAVDGSFIVAYLTFGNPATIKMNSLTASKVKAQWYDPRQGSWQHIEEYSNTGVQKFTPPTHGDQNDWVLVLEDTEKNYPLEHAMNADR